jgi:flagellar hook-length control protein FliK
MSENFLSFISNVDAKPADASLSDDASPAEKISQGAEFNNILLREQGKAQGGSRAAEMVQQGREQAIASPETTHDEERLELPPNAEAPVALPTRPVSGNSLPELSIHSAALKVGRVILTTANPKVSEESLSQFARSQGADVLPPMAEAPDEHTTTKPQGPNTQNILQGLMGGLAQPATSRPDQPLAAKGLKVSATEQSLDPEAAQDSRLQFVQRTGVSQAKVGNAKNALPAVGLPLTQSMKVSSPQQPIDGVNTTAAKGADARRAPSELTQQPIDGVNTTAAKGADVRRAPSELTQQPIDGVNTTAAKGADVRRAPSELTQQPITEVINSPAKGADTRRVLSELAQQPIAEVKIASANGFDTQSAMPNPSQGPVVDVSRAAANAIGNQNVTSKYQPSPSASAEFAADKSLNEGRLAAKSESIPAPIALGGNDIDKPMPLLADGAQEELQQQNQSQSLAPPASTPVSAQGGLIQAPVTNVPVSLADALMSSDPAQMQSRLQPYQAWTQRFGEVLAQKLALAVKDGNWTVKLNLNPASLGPVGVELQVRDGGIEGQIAASDPNVRQLLGDSMPKLRQSLEALVGEQGGVNIELADGRDHGSKRGNEQEIELSIDLLADELVPSQQDMASGNILRDGLNVFV